MLAESYQSRSWLGWHSVEALAEWLHAWKLDEGHQEPDPVNDSTYHSNGYVARLCADCGRVLLIGKGVLEERCGQGVCEQKRPG